MPDPGEKIRKGWHSRLVGSTNPFNTVIGSQLYFMIAPKGIDAPYSVFSLLPINPSRDSANKFYKCVIQCNHYAETEGDCEQIVSYYYDRMEDCETDLIIDGFKVNRVEREPQIPLGYVNKLWGIATQYRLEIQT